MLQAARALAGRSGRFILCGLGANLSTLLKVTGFDQLLRDTRHACGRIVGIAGRCWLAGADHVTGYRVPGTRFECAFCGTCGSRVPWERDEELCVPAGCLDGDPGVRPTDQIFTDSRAAWTVVDERLATWAEAGSWSRT